MVGWFWVVKCDTNIRKKLENKNYWLYLILMGYVSAM